MPAFTRRFGKQKDPETAKNSIPVLKSIVTAMSRKALLTEAKSSASFAITGKQQLEETSTNQKASLQQLHQATGILANYFSLSSAKKTLEIRDHFPTDSLKNVSNRTEPLLPFEQVKQDTAKERVVYNSLNFNSDNSAKQTAIPNQQNQTSQDNSAGARTSQGRSRG